MIFHIKYHEESTNRNKKQTYDDINLSLHKLLLQKENLES
jgi:hypothetical protein